ncbi:MAG: hypothetical protein AAFY51_11340 [Pseudomonadota bacterium]
MYLRIILAAVLASIVPSVVHAQSEGSVDEQREGPHHLSVISGLTYVDEADETAYTLGIDYEYRVSDLLGVGFVAERAFGNVEATTLLAVADFHLTEGLAMQVGPGIEFAEGEEFAVGRFGVLYEFELGGGFTISPQAHYDLSELEDAFVFVVGVGRAF